MQIGVSMINRTSPLRVDINPWALDDNVNDVMALRGTFVAALGAIETTLTELAIRASKHESYIQIREKFPSRRPDRLKYLRKIIEIDGPLSPYSKLIEAILARYEQQLELRDFLAHGRMQILSHNGGEAMIKLEDYKADGQFVMYRTKPIILSELRHKSHKAALFSRCVGMLYGQTSDILPVLDRSQQG